MRPRLHLTHSVRPSKIFEAYWRFAAERQEIFSRRLSGTEPPWTADPVLQAYRFTNVYRASDRVSQYLIRNVAYAGDQSPRELFFRILLFKIFNRIDTWQLLTESLGQISFAEYQFERYDAVLSGAMDKRRRIYSPAYIMPSAGPGIKKHRAYLKLIEQMARDNIPERLQACRCMEEGFALLRSYPMIGDFLAYQFIVDVNYSTLTDFSEMEFVAPGPGTRDGIKKCFLDTGCFRDTDVIRMMADIQEEQFASMGILFRTLWGRRLQLADCANLFCEVGKYARCTHPDVADISGRTRIKQRFHANPEPIRYWFPPKWGMNHLLDTGACKQAAVTI